MDGQGQFGAGALFTAGWLGGCAEAEVCAARTYDQVLHASGVSLGHQWHMPRHPTESKPHERRLMDRVWPCQHLDLGLIRLPDFLCDLGQVT